MGAQPRVRDTESVKSRLAKGGVKQRSTRYIGQGHDHLPGYVSALYPNTPVPDRMFMVNLLKKYLDQNPDAPTPNAHKCDVLFQGLYTTPATHNPDVKIHNNPRENYHNTPRVHRN